MNTSRIKLKLAIVASGKRHYDLATETNSVLEPEQHLSEHDITRIVTSRKTPTHEQAEALAAALNKSKRSLFPNVK